MPERTSPGPGPGHGSGHGHGTKYKAVLVAITDAASVPAELRPFVEFRATIERREVGPKDLVAIFNVHGTSSHFVVFLDAGKTMEQVDKEIAPYEVVLQREARERIADALETQALHRQATG